MQTHSKKKKFDASQVEKQEQAIKARDLVINSAKEALSTIGEIEKGIQYFGLTGGLPSIPGSERANWESNVNKLMAQQVLDVMSSLKNASKTGATGFGQLSEKELSLLKNAATALKRTLSSEDATRYLNQIKDSFSKVLQPQNDSLSQEAPLTSGQLSTGLKWSIE